MKDESWLKRKLNTYKRIYDEDVVKSTRFPEITYSVRLGLIVALFGFGSFFLWAVIFKLDSAAIATGQIKVSSRTKDVQHLEGGIVDKIFVKNGDDVKKGDQLVLLSSKQSIAHTKSLQLKYFSLKALEARLKAELSGNSKIDFPKELSEDKNKQAQAMMADQMALFKARIKQHKKHSALLEAKIIQLKKEATSLSAKINTSKTEIIHLEKEVKSYQDLHKNKQVEKVALLKILRELANEKGALHDVEASVARVNQHIHDTKIQIVLIEKEHHEQVIKELGEVRDQIALVNEEYQAAKDVSRRALITAPANGKVVNLAIDTLGSVISPGQVVLQIVPTGEPMVVEAKVSPLDIDVVTVGKKARVQLSSLKTRHVDPLDAEVTNVSAESIIDEKTGEYYYLTELKIDPKSLKKLPKDIKLTPGMPTEVMILLHKQTMLSYLIQPIRDTFGRAFRED